MAGVGGDFFAWCTERGFFAPSSDQRAASHTLMSGGKLYVPPTHNTEFATRMARAIFARGEQMSVIERYGDVFHGFCDLDIYARTPFNTNDDLIEHYVAPIQRITEEMFGEEAAGQRIVMMRAPNVVQKNGATHTQYGVHVVWPRIIMSRELALAWRDVVLSQLARDDPLWPTVFDKTVYKNGGLRMLGSYKMAGGANVGRIYTVVHEMPDPDADSPTPVEDVDLLERFTRQMLLSLVRVPGGRVTDVTPHSRPEWYDSAAWVEPSRTEATTQARVAAKRRAEEELPAMSYSDFSRNRIATWFAQKFPGRPTITTVQRRDTKTLTFIVSTSCRFCPNVNREHRSNTVYFIVQSSGRVVQRCRCTCTPTDGSTPCSKWKSESIQIPPEVFSSITGVHKHRRSTDPARPPALNDVDWTIPIDKMPPEMAAIASRHCTSIPRAG